MLQRMDTLGSLWDQCADDLLMANKSTLQAHEGSSEDFPLDKFSHMWLETWSTVRRIKSETAIGSDIQMDTRLINWAETQAAYHQRRTIKAKAIKSMLEINHWSESSDIDPNNHYIYQQKHKLDFSMETNHPYTIQMPSLKRCKSELECLHSLRVILFRSPSLMLSSSVF